jgi:hypothetical protein
LMLRRRKSEATRVKAPGLSETRATNVWSMIYLSTCRGNFVYNQDESRLLTI